MRRTPPSMDFFPDDFVGGTHYLEAIEVGMYIRSICFLWGKSALPEEHAKLAKIMGVSAEEFDKHWPSIADKFHKDANGGLVQPRVKAELEKKLRISEARARAGRHGGRPAKSKTKTKSKAFAKQMPSKTEVGSRKREVGSRKEEAGSRKTEVDAVVRAYQVHHPRSKPGTKERALISARLRDGYSVDDLIQAVEGCHRSPYHCGENDRHTKYQSLSLIMRDSDHVAQFMDVPKRVPEGRNQHVFDDLMAELGE